MSLKIEKKNEGTKDTVMLSGRLDTTTAPELDVFAEKELADTQELVLSHDEVVHLKCSMINKMPGEEADKFANLKAGYAFMMGHPGKKLLFMGQDIGQYREWSEERELD